MNFAGMKNVPARTGTAMIAVLLLAMLTPTLLHAEEPTAADAELSFALTEALLAPLQRKAGELRGSGSGQEGVHRRGIISKNFKKIDDDTYEVSFQQATATADTLTTERLSVTLKRKGSDTWQIADEKVVDSYDLYRQHGFRVYPFEKFHFSKEGLDLSASKGFMFESYLAGKVIEIIVVAGDMRQQYAAPKYRAYDQLYKLVLEDYRDELVFDPQLFEFTCDPQTCEELIAESFTGLDRPPADQAGPVLTRPDDLPDWVDSELRGRYVDEYKDMMEERQENPFAHYRRATLAGNRWFIAWAEKDDKHGIGLAYDNWAGYEYRFIVSHDAPGSKFFQPLVGYYTEETKTDDSSGQFETHQREGARRYDVADYYEPIFGYYSDETLAAHSLAQIEERYEKEERWYDVHKIAGEVEIGLSDPDSVHGDITFGLTLRNDAKELPFFLLTRRRGEDEKLSNQTLFINSVEYQGNDLTCVRTGPFSFLVVLPEELPAGSKIDLKVDFSTRVIMRISHAFSIMSREGWLPFVRGGDLIEEFDLIVEVSDNYDVLATGTKVSEEKSDGVLRTHWVAESAVEFPTVAFGRYSSDSPKTSAAKKDGGEIQVTVYVDDASMQSDAGAIRAKQLRPIGGAAVNALNIYRDFTGVDYPYSQLTLVNDPTVILEGPAHSGVVSLSPLVFRGESLATELVSNIAGREDVNLPGMVGAGGERTSRYFRSLVAHGVAHQWWGSRVSPANNRSYWLSEALATYSAAVWLANVGDTADYDRVVEDWRKTILDTDQRASVQDAVTSWAGGGAFPGESTLAALFGRGPFVIHMLRQTFGNQKFFPAFQQISNELAEKGEVVTEDVRLAAESAFAMEDPEGGRRNVDLTWFFDQWVRGAGIPQFNFKYDTRRAEDGTWIVEGTVGQRVLVGSRSNYDVLEETYYRALAHVTVTGTDGNEYPVRFPVQGPETPFAFKIPVEPREVVFNKHNEILAHDVLVNRDF